MECPVLYDGADSLTDRAGCPSRECPALWRAGLGGRACESSVNFAGSLDQLF